MSARAAALVASLWVLTAALHPEAPEDTRFLGGSVGGALTVLGQAGERSQTSNVRGFGDRYGHWAAASASSTTAPVARASTPPIVAGLVGLAAVTGLRDLAALGLYLRSEEAEHEGDWDLLDLCLEAIPFVDPHFVDAYLVRAWYLKQTDPARAERILLQGLRWNPEDWELWSDLAWLALRPPPPGRPDPARALRFLDGATATRHPWFVRRLRAAVLFHVGRSAEAEALYQEILGAADLPDQDRRMAEAGLAEVRRGFDRIRVRLLDAPTPATAPAVPCPCGHEHGPGGHHHHDHGE